MRQHATSPGGGGLRMLRIVAAIAIGIAGFAMLIGSAGFLFMAAVHPPVSTGWTTALAGAAVLAALGSFAFGQACRQVWLCVNRSPRMLDAAGFDDAMWIG